MKQTTCRALRGPCDEPISGETPEAMGEAAKRHVMSRIMAGDDAHTKAAQEMVALPPEEQAAWYETFKAGFDALPEA